MDLNQYINPRGTTHAMLDHAPRASQTQRVRWLKVFRAIKRMGNTMIPLWDMNSRLSNPDVAEWGSDETIEQVARMCAKIRTANADVIHRKEKSDVA